MDHSQHSMHDVHSMHDDSLHELAASTTVIPDVMHDHSSHGGGGHDANSMVHHMMSMSFHFGCDEVILFEGWKTSSALGIIGSFVAIFVMAALYEALKYYREYLFWKTYNALQYRAVSVPEKNVVSEESNRVVHMVGEVIHKQPPSMMSCMHFYQTMLHILQVTLSFLLMLIFMTYNVWLCIAVVLGAAFGYFLFGWRKSVIVDVTEHCH